jgi:hypothetical protein
MCPLCGEENEDNIHIFTCTHSQQERPKQELLLYLAKQQHSKEMPAIAQVLEWALTNCGNYNWMVDKLAYPQDLHKAIEEQNKIGWNQILYGCISAEFGRVQEQFYRWQQLSTKLHNDKKWTRDLILKIWETMIKLWHNRTLVNMIKMNSPTHNT